MPTFTYETLKTDGSRQTGQLAADDRAQLVRMLLDRGETPTSVTELDGAATATAPRRGRAAAAAAGRSSDEAAVGLAAIGARLQQAGSGRPTLSPAQLGQFIRELATALEAGLPLMQSLRTMRQQAAGKALPVILDHLLTRVEAGDPLYAAARDYGRPFDEMIIGMLRAADASGDMSVVLHQLADLLERNVQLRRDVTGALIYPAIVATLLLGSVVVLVTVLVPRLIAPMAAEGNFNMPWPTQVLLDTASFIQSWWWLAITVGLAAVMGWWAWVSIPANRLRFDRLKLRVPVLGRVLRDVAVVRFTRTLGTLVATGLPILDALRITRRTLGNAALSAAIEEVESQVTAGKSLAVPLEKSGLFPPLLVQVVNLGERAGRLDQMLSHATTAFDRQVDTSIKVFSKSLQPLLLMVMALVGAFVLMAILLPMLEMQSMIQ
ncbi:MAG: type II secretion system F family protein [Planctomycetota bacterium]|jgi:general secretion pathway protein F